jgi:hypothetical protein
LWRYHPPDFIKTKNFSSQHCHMQMAIMGWVEGTTNQPDIPTPRIMKQRGCQMSTVRHAGTFMLAEFDHRL